MKQKYNVLNGTLPVEPVHLLNCCTFVHLYTVLYIYFIFSFDATLFDTHTSLDFRGKLCSLSSLQLFNNSS